MLWFLLLLALIAAAVIAVVVFRHWKEIRLLDPDTIRAEQERKVRDRIVKQRFDRRLRHTLAPLERTMRATAERLTRTVRQVEERIAQAAGAARSAVAGTADDTPVPDDIRLLLSEAAGHVKAGRTAQAERTYLEVLKHDSRQVAAYRGLGFLYAGLRQDAQAKETFAFLERIGGCDDACWAARAAVAEREHNLPDAETFRKRAADAAPKRAGRHAELALFYLQHGSPDYALASARRASDLEPENPRWLELCVESAILLRDRVEAERRFERLRSITDDRGRLYALKEKLDTLSS